MRPCRFVIEAVMLAVYGQLAQPPHQVPIQYFIPYSTVLELYDFLSDNEPIMPSERDDQFIKEKIRELIAFFEEDFNRKKIEKIATVPWRVSSPLMVSDQLTLHIVHAVGSALDMSPFDPIEEDLIATAMRESIPILTDQVDFVERLIEHEVAVQVFDIDDFEYALESGSQL